MADPTNLKKTLLAFAFGGAQHVGGNKFLLIPAFVSGAEITFSKGDKGDKGILIDFGKDFNIRKQFLMDPFEEYRKSSILYDAIFLGEIPPATTPLRGLYRSDLLSHGNTLLKEMGVEPSIRDTIFGLDGGPEGQDPIRTPELIGGLLISHNHADHIGYVDLLNENIPFYTSKAGKEMLSFMGKVSDYFDKDNIKFLSYEEEDTTPRQDRDVKVLAEITSENQVGSLEFTAIEGTQFQVAACPVDHSIPGACALFIKYGDTKLVYTGDFREEGYMSEKSKLFIDSVDKFKPNFVFCEGTKLGEHPEHKFTGAPTETVTTEAEVKKSIQEKLTADSNRLAFFDYRWNDFSRLVSILLATKEAKRTVVLTWKAYASLLALKESATIRSLFNQDIQKALESIFKDVEKNGLVQGVKVFLATRGYGDHKKNDYRSDKPFKYAYTMALEAYNNINPTPPIQKIEFTGNHFIASVGLTAQQILAEKGKNKYLVMITENQCPYLVEFFDGEPLNPHNFFWLRYHYNDFDLNRLYGITVNWCELFKIAKPLVIHTSGHSTGDNITAFLKKGDSTKILIHTESDTKIEGVDIKMFSAGTPHKLQTDKPDFSTIENPTFKVI